MHRQKPKELCHNNPNWTDNMKDMSPSRARFSLISELIYLRSEELNYVAHCFAKYGVEVFKKFYLQFFSNREAAHLS